MSKSTNSQNKNTTSTSTSRRGKKPNKASSSDETAQPKPVVENTDQAEDITTSSKDSEVVVEPTSVSAENPPAPQSTPAVNIWELRKIARAAEQALKQANDAIDQIAKKTEAAKKAEASKLDDGFTTVTYKKKQPSTTATKPAPESAAKPATKPSPATPAPTATKPAPESAAKPATKPSPATPAPTATKPAPATPAPTATKPAPTTATKPVTKPAPKPATKGKPSEPSEPCMASPKGKPSEPSAEQVAYRKRKGEALMTAQRKLIADSRAQLKKKDIDDINNCLPYVVNYKRTHVVQFDSDPFVVEVEGDKFEFSRARFFENRFFQEEFRRVYETLVPEGWIRFFPGREENSFCIGVKKRSD